MECHRLIVFGHLPGCGKPWKDLSIMRSGYESFKHMIRNSIAVVSGGIIDIQRIPGGYNSHCHNLIFGAGGVFRPRFAFASRICLCLLGRILGLRCLISSTGA